MQQKGWLHRMLECCVHVTRLNPCELFHAARHGEVAQFFVTALPDVHRRMQLLFLCIHKESACKLLDSLSRAGRWVLTSHSAFSRFLPDFLVFGLAAA